MKFGATFSYKYALEMSVDPKECLKAALDDLGVRRLRLMSYWDLHEPKQGSYDFTELDWQVDMAEQSNCAVLLCLGLRQPRWPESHWPAWAKVLPDAEWQKALDDYITVVVNRYKGRKCILSYELENEALLKAFGLDGNYDRNRLKREFKLVKTLDPSRIVIMSTSDSGGFPLFGPKPDMYSYTIYRYFFRRGKYRHSVRPAWTYHLRAQIIYLFKRRKSFIHELQAEPWGPEGTSKLTVEEQFKSMNRERVQEAVAYVRRTQLLPADLWGLEWWYWLKTAQDMPEIWNDLKPIFAEE
ncbi:MAG: hypothetical protein JWO47_698 [Candidatus Saccharibacteria bacterium]|nr:hypothetical protein [Candidatus Saccharibacteria bacterium]